MKHAILIIAYHNFDFVIKQLKKYDDDFSIFIHWDKRSALTNKQKEELFSIRTVKYVGEEYAVNWGSYGIVRATLLLCNKALQDGEVEYFHLISDADALVADLNIFKEFYRVNRGRNFLHSELLQLESEAADKIKYVHQLEKYNIRVNDKERERYNEELKIQKKEGLKKELPECDLYWGSAWWSLTRDCIKYIMSKSDFIEKYYVNTLFPDEMFVQTVVMNSVFSQTVNNKNERYISWGLRNGNNPAILDRSDLHKILNGKYHFARKVSPQISRDLLDTIDTIVFQEYKPIDSYDIELLSLIQTMTSGLKASSKGLMYGNAGALIFLSHCFQLKIATDIITPKLLHQLQNMVTAELKDCKDPTYSTGKLGLVITLEYIRVFNKFIVFDIETESILEQVNTTIVNKVYNKLESLSERGVYNVYFQALKYGKNLNNLSSYAWEYLRIKDTSSNKILVNHLNNGLKGLSGIGLHILSQKYGLAKNKWSFLFI